MSKSNNKTHSSSYNVRENRLKDMPYEQYLKSDEWRRVKSWFKDRYGILYCDFCRSTKRIQLHHCTYKYIHSHSPQNDIIPLCRDCHERVHAYAKTYRTDVFSATKAVRKRVCALTPAGAYLGPQEKLVVPLSQSKTYSLKPISPIIETKRTIAPRLLILPDSDVPLLNTVYEYETDINVIKMSLRGFNGTNKYKSVNAEDFFIQFLKDFPRRNNGKHVPSNMYTDTKIAIDEFVDRKRKKQPSNEDCS